MANQLIVPKKHFFYDAQISRILIQVGAKCFGGYQVVSGTQYDGMARTQTVPCVFSGYSRVVQQLFGGNGDNVVPTLPMISYSITGLQRKLSEIRDPQNKQQYVIHTRKRDANGNLLVNEPGEFLVLERYMPVPYELQIELVIWASNWDQMFQITEQMGSQFNPDLEISISDSPFDWTSPTRILHAGNFSYDKPTPAEDPDPTMTATASFVVTTRLSAPVRIFDATLIHEISVNIREMEDFAYFYYGDNIDISQMPLIDGLTIMASEEDIVQHNNQ